MGCADQGYKGFMDTEVHIQAQATTDSGITYGSYVAMDLFQAEDVDSAAASTPTRRTCSSRAASAGSSWAARTAPKT